MEITRHWLLIALFVLVSCQSKTEFDWQEGDILFQDGDCGGFCEAIKKVTPDYNGRHFSHNGLLIRENGEWHVLEAVSVGVKITSLDDFLNRHLDEKSRPKVLVGRLKATYQNLIPQAISHARMLIDKPYDHIFDLNNDAYYCSELIHLSFAKANSGQPLFEVQPMTFKDPDTGYTFPIWQNYFEELNTRIPEGEPGLNPGGMTYDPALDIIHDFTAN